MATTATMAFPIRFRTFPLAEAEAARAWLTA
jgi:hypothetical protein